MIAGWKNIPLPVESSDKVRINKLDYNISDNLSLNAEEDILDSSQFNQGNGNNLYSQQESILEILENEELITFFDEKQIDSIVFQKAISASSPGDKIDFGALDVSQSEDLVFSHDLRLYGNDNTKLFISKRIFVDRGCLEISNLVIFWTPEPSWIEENTVYNR